MAAHADALGYPQVPEGKIGVIHVPFTQAETRSQAEVAQAGQDIILKIHQVACPHKKGTVKLAFHAHLQAIDALRLYHRPHSQAEGAGVEPQGVNRLQMGMEGELYRSFFVRTGYLMNFQDDVLSGLRNLSLGAGFRLREWNVDYAYLPFGDLGVSQRISVGCHFAPSPASPAAAQAKS